MPALILLAALLGIAAIVGVVLHYRLGIAKLAAMQDGADYKRGARDGMDRAATILETGSGAATSGPFTPSPQALARMVRAAMSNVDN